MPKFSGDIRSRSFVSIGLAIAAAAAIAFSASAADTTIGAGVTKTPADLGSPADRTVVQSGGTLEIGGNTTAGQSLFTISGTGVGDVGAIHSVSGSNTLSGNIGFDDSTSISADSGSQLTIDGNMSSAVAQDLDLSIGGDGDILYTGNLNLGAPGGSYSFFKTGNGTLTLTGANNSYTGYLSVQDGTLEISGGGRLTVTGASASDATFIDGNLAVTGTGSAFSVQNYAGALNYIVVGRDTTASTSVTVNGGATLTTGASAVGEGIAYAQSSQITATVDGPGSAWDFGAGFNMGAATGGTASLTISNGGTMQSTIGGQFSIGRGGDGTATVTDTGSKLATDAAVTVGELFDGNAGTGALVIDNGGLVTAGQANIGVGATGTATVRAGSQLQAGSFLGIGQAASDYTRTVSVGHGDLTIENGGLAAADDVWIGFDAGLLSGSTGALTVLGTAGNRGVLETASLMKGNDSASVLFDGGVLRATANSADVGKPFIWGYSGTFAVDVGANGMFIDTQAYDVTASAVLVDDDATNPGFLDKQGSGRLVLTADNSFSGGTTISAGTLQLGAGGTSGWIIGDVTDNGILAFDRSDTKTFAGTITGNGGVRQISSGKTILTADSSALSGISQVQNGTLSVNGILGGSMEVRGGRLQGIGQVGDTTNFAGGTIAPGNSIGTLTVAGNYAGSGGTLEIETALGGDSSATDKLVVAGNTTGNTKVRVINVGGTGAQTVEGIKIVDVAGTSGGSFTLVGSYTFEGDPAVVAGAYAYRLYQGGTSTPADGDWYLRSVLEPSAAPLLQAGAPIYEAYAGVLQSFNELETMQQRLGNRSWSDATVAANTPPDIDGSGSGMWGRVLGRRATTDPRDSTTGASYDTDIWQLQAGADGQFYSGDAGDLTGGLSMRYGAVSADVSSIVGDGSIDTTGYGLGGSLTWHGAGGFYVDAQANATWYDSDLSSATAATSLVSGNDGFGYAFGLEAGRQIALGTNWSVTPQAQLTYSAVDYDRFVDTFGGAVSLTDAHSLRGRLAISADYEDSWTAGTGLTSRLHAYGIANIYYAFHASSDTRLSGVRLASEQEALWGGLGLGGTYNWGNDRYALYGEATVDASLGSFGESHALAGRMGLNVKF